MNMKNKNRFIAETAIIAGLYAALTYAQGVLLPGSTTAAVQFRVSEALNVFALFTPAAIPGLTIGCVIANLYSIGQGLPLDMIFGSIATLGATVCIWLMRKIKIFSNHYPLLSMLMPAIWNGVIVGWEIEFFFVDGTFQTIGFLTNGGFVALGELVVMLTLGTILYYTFEKRGLHTKLFGNYSKNPRP